ncbi:MAG: dihydrolipoamide acetyltransferase family protein, partial [Burkholderiales bacterium]
MYEFKMPSLGADMEAGTLVEWMVKPGDSVKRGQVVAVVETQKGAIEIEIWQPGVIDRVLLEPGSRVPVGTTLALLRGVGEPVVMSPAVASAPEPPPATTVEAAPAVQQPLRPRVSPAARKRAEELGIAIESILPSLPGGVISREDVERASAATVATPKPIRERVPQADWRSDMRKAIAAAMAKSKREIPHYYLAADIDVTPTMQWLAVLNARRPVDKRLLPVIPLMKAVALALRSVPGLNGLYREGKFDASPAIHLGTAIAMRGGGLVAPAIHDADLKTVDELMEKLRDLIERVREGRLRSSELADSTVTLTSLGDQGADRVYGVIYPPQVAIIGFGKVRERPWVVDGAVV